MKSIVQSQLIKKKNIENYAKQVDRGEPIRYNVDEDRRYRRQLEFCGMLVKAGLLVKDDFLE